MKRFQLSVFGLCTLFLLAGAAAAEGEKPAAKPKVVVLGVNGAEWDLLRPLLVRGEMPNLARVIENGVSGKLQTVSAPNCPKVYSAIFTSAAPEDNGVTGFVVAGQSANTNMLKREPFFNVLSKRGITVGMANVPATFPVLPVNGYMVSGMMTRGKECEDGILCSPKLSEVQGGDAVYPPSLKAELLEKVGDYYIDCARMPSAKELKGREAEVITKWLEKVSLTRQQQTKLFDHLLTNHPTDFTFFSQACEDRVGHWLYPIQPHNVGYDPKVHEIRKNAFPDQYRALDKVIGKILEHVDENTYFMMVADHGIKPLREQEPPDAHADHGGTTPVIAKHDYHDGDEVPGAFVIMGPKIKKNMRMMGLPISVYDVAPTILHLYGIEKPATMRGRVITEVFVGAPDQHMASTGPAHSH